MCYTAFVGWKIVARGRFSRVGLSLVYERLTSPAKGFAPFLAPLGARGDLQNFGRRPNYRIPVAAAQIGGYRWLTAGAALTVYLCFTSTIGSCLLLPYAYGLPMV